MLREVLREMLRKVLRKVIDAVKELEEIEEIEGVDKYENKSLINMVGPQIWWRAPWKDNIRCRQHPHGQIYL